MNECPRMSPWGHIDYQEPIAEGIWTVGTPSHGGIYVAPHIMETEMPAELRETNYSQGGWYEEDSDWCIPFIVFEERIKHGPNKWARTVIERGLHTKEFGGKYHALRREFWEQCHENA